MDSVDKYRLFVDMECKDQCKYCRDDVPIEYTEEDGFIHRAPGILIECKASRTRQLSASFDRIADVTKMKFKESIPTEDGWYWIEERYNNPLHSHVDRKVYIVQRKYGEWYFGADRLPIDWPSIQYAFGSRIEMPEAE